MLFIFHFFALPIDKTAELKSIAIFYQESQD